MKVAPIDKLSLVFMLILAFIILKEKVTLAVVVGGVLMTAGALIIGFGK